jgi:hypothetical protein
MFLYQKPTDYSNRDVYVGRQSLIHKDILNDNWTFFCEEFKVPLTLLYWLVLWLVFPLFLVKVVFMGRVIISVITFLTTSLGHNKILGYRNEEVRYGYRRYGLAQKLTTKKMEFIRMSGAGILAILTVTMLRV